MDKDVKIFNNLHDFYKFVKNYAGELVIKHNFSAYENGVLKAKLIK